MFWGTNKMRLIFDLNTNLWSYDVSDIDGYSESIDFYFSFKSDEDSYVEFDNLRFGYFITLDNNQIVNEEYPKGNVSYINSDQEYLEVSRVDGFRQNRTYQIEFWVENSGNRFFESAEFSIPLPPKPFNSWVWDDEKIEWIAPIAYPEDDQAYSWNEELQSWILV